jgi:TBC1 domain family member 13
VLARILFIYGKLNPGVRYVQGMNEILAVIYYCFWPHSDNEDPDEVLEDDPFQEYFESDLFFCFTMLMAEIRDGFLRAMDNEPSGINGKIRIFSQLMLKVDPDLYYHL